MATSANVLYNILSGLFCCSTSINSSRKKPNLENFAIDSEFSDTSTPAHRQPRHASLVSTALSKDETRKGHHPYERIKNSSLRKSSLVPLRSQNTNTAKELLDQNSGLGCSESNGLYAKSIPDGHEFDATKTGDDKQSESKHVYTKTLGKEQEYCRISASSLVRSTNFRPQLAKMDDWKGTVDMSEYTRDLEGTRTAVNDQGDIISSYKEPSFREAFDTDATGNVLSRASSNEMEDRKIGLESMEAFLVSKQHCESSSEDIESETEVSYAIDFHDRKTFNKILSRRMLAFIKFRQNNTRKQP